MKRLYIITVLVALLSVSCNDWLDVRPDTEQKDKDLFTTYKGFQDALTGCYMSLASQDVYGERLTMSNIESLANLWYQFRNSTRYEDNDLMNHGRLLQGGREDHLCGIVQRDRPSEHDY